MTHTTALRHVSIALYVCLAIGAIGCHVTGSVTGTGPTGQSPLKVRGGSVKGMSYDAANNWTISNTSASITLDEAAATLSLDGVDPVNQVNEQPQQIGPINIPTNWKITLTFRSSTQANQEDPNTKMYICTKLDAHSTCQTDGNAPGQTIYFLPDSGNTTQSLFQSFNADMPGMRFDLYCNIGVLCTDSDSNNHIHSIKVEWQNSSPSKYHCDDGLCVITINP